MYYAYEYPYTGTVTSCNVIRSITVRERSFIATFLCSNRFTTFICKLEIYTL